MTNRRDFYRLGTLALGGLMTLALGVPGVAYLLDPIVKRKGKEGDKAAGEDGGAYYTLARLDELEVGVPQSFPVVAERTDAWVKYPAEPVGSVWLIRQPEGSKDRVVAFSAECPHLGCGVNLAADRKSFACPCHTSAFAIDGTPKNEVPPRPMDRLDVKLSGDDDPKVAVRFQRFRAQSKEQIPLA